ncbi:MAG: IclR family transcriptional regulator [Proteobacteria bacterium]|nr:IclR family transcriptional regulator [Pseudomonadota bacterium]
MKDDVRTATPSYQVPGLERGLRLMEVFTRDRREFSLAELTRLLDLPRATVFRLVTTLEQNGYLDKEPLRKTYRLGNRVLRLGFEFLASQDVVTTAHPFLEQLSRDTGASAHLGVLDDRDVLYLDRIAGSNHLVSNVGVGTRFPAHATTMGRVLLAGLGADAVQKLYENVDLPKATDQTPQSLPALLERLTQEQEDGYVTSVSAFEAGLSSIAAPVRNSYGTVIAAISIAGPESQLDHATLEGEIRARVCQTAADISNVLGAGKPAHNQKPLSAVATNA